MIPSSTSTAASRLTARIAIFRAVALALSSVLFLGAGFTALFFDSATHHQANLYWTGLGLAIVVMLATALNPWAGLAAGLAEIAVCSALAQSFHDSMLRVFSMPSFPLAGIATITIIANILVAADTRLHRTG